MLPKSIGIALLASLMIVAPLATAAHPSPGPAGELKFILSADGAGNGRLDQYRNDGPGSHFTASPDPTPVGVFINGCQTWVSDEAAQVDITLPAQDVDYALVFGILTGVESVAITVGKQTTGGGFMGVASDVITGTGLQTMTPISGTIPASAYTGLSLSSGEWIATRICATFVNDALGGDAAIETSDGDSFVVYQGPENPPFPVPEFGTLILSLLGVLGIVAGAVHMRRKDE